MRVCLLIKELNSQLTQKGHLGPLHGKQRVNGEAFKTDQEE